jgi:3-hydroxybutyrate dehydrogenase
MTTLSGKTALVTGSTSGIGLGIALSLAKAGANVVLNGFGDASAVIAEVQQYGGKVGHHPADVSDPEQIANMVSYAEREFGGIDILVNNAGIQHVASVEEFPVERWDSIIAINLSSVFHSTRLCLSRMRAKNWGRIINIASVHGQVGSVGKAAYVAAKHGVIGLTKVVGLETATTQVTWCRSRLMIASPPGSIRNRRNMICWPRNSRRWSSSPRRNWVNWCCSCAVKRVARCGARPGILMVGGWRSNYP